MKFINFLKHLIISIYKNSSKTQFVIILLILLANLLIGIITFIKVVLPLHMLQFNKINKLIIFLLFTSIILFLSINYNSCFKSPPHGYINGYSSLVYSREFCIEDYKDIIYFKTNYQGARILETLSLKILLKSLVIAKYWV